MTIQLGTTLRNALLDQIETTAGTAPKVQIRSGAQPANCAAADSGTLLAEITLDADWASAASAGVKTFTGLPKSAVASGTGTAAHYRFKDSAGTVTHMQGTVTATGGGGDMTIDNTSVASGQTVQITSWTITAPGA
ncbi:hypothetical protein J2W32_004460 [Variovorax boronicumulans]|uniref:Phage tail protein n=1 Tax=Variovorax boronicumulans TaxID=436515 RepID=A0AAW8D5S5_9BURK|nr:hypothetical protein [Variovorax boronicumulans]MDP9895362.1 hypothetical protein [Variovorax boronicumulans]MDQ0055402.1 hypothetical protein [Variovorax boronicumulans]